MKKYLSLLLAVCMIILAVTGCGSSNEPAPAPEAPEQSLNVAIGYQFTTLDPGTSTETGNDYVIDHLYAGMFRKDENGKAYNELCKEYTVSEDGLTYTFTLKDDIFWSDGTPITAMDFEYGILRGLSFGVDNAYAIKEITSYLKGGLEYSQNSFEVGNSFDCTTADHSGVGVQAVDEKTLIIELCAPCPFLPELMTSRAWIAVPQGTPQHDSTWSLKSGFVSSGPYKIEDINANEKAVLVKNEYYFGKDDVTLDKITYFCMTDEDAQALAFQSGEIDVACTVAATACEQYEGTDNLMTINEGNSYFIAINSASTGPEYLKDVKVRRALALAIDKDALSEVLGSSYYPKLNGFIPHGSAGMSGDFRDEGDADGYTLVYDPDQAKALLAEAGYGENNPLNITYKYSNNSIHEDVATMLQSFWAAVGVNVSFDCVEYGVYYDQVDQGEFELCRYADSVADNAIRLLKLWTTGGQVVAAVSDPVYDEMCDKVIQTADPTEYAKGLHELEDYLVEENVYLIPLFEYVSPVLVADKVENIEMSGVHPYFAHTVIE